jgi:hypothetical protein
MKYLRKFNESDSYSIFNSDGWKKLLPEKLILVTSTGNWELNLPQENYGLGHATNITNLMNGIQIDYSQITPNSEKGEVLKDGEPGHLCIDIDIMKDNDGTSANPDTLKLNVSISYGDAMSAEFVVQKPNKVDVINYNGFNSKLDPETCFGFEDDSILGLVNFFNSWGYQLNKTDFTFLDKYLNSYNPQNESIELKPSFDDNYILVINNSNQNELHFNNLKKYLEFRGVKYKIASNSNDIEKIYNEYNIIGVISTGNKPNILNSNINCPKFLISHQFNSLGNTTSVDKNIKGNYTLTKYTDHPLFKNIDLTTIQFSFDFNDKLNNCPDGFKVIGELNDTISSIVNDDEKIWATLFHPEDIEYTYQILDNFLDICNYSPESKIDYLKGGNKIDNIIEKYHQFIKRVK